MDIIFDYIPIISFPLLVVIGVTIFLIKASFKGKLIRPFKTTKILFWFLILWTLLGFFTQQDFTERCGCLTHSRGVFSLDYIAFSAISLTLLISGFLVKKKNLRISLLYIELTYWIFKLFILKSGYQGGLGILIFKYYDFLGLLCRLLLLNSLFDNKFKEYLFAIIAGLLIFIKMLGFPCNDNFVYSDYLNPYYNKLMFKRLNGYWTGTIIYPKDTTVYAYHDSTYIDDLFSLTDTNRDSIIFKKKEKVYFYFNDSHLRIDSSSIEFDGKYSLYYSQPDSRNFKYLPNRYLDSIKHDYKYGRFLIDIHVVEVNDSILTLQIENGEKFKLKTAERY